ncbi:MAG: hypothetical protein WDN26_08210 [Chitinophagaceae bacterium]
MISIKKPWRYVTSFLGIIDLLAIIPSYLSIFFVGAQSSIGVPGTAPVAHLPHF